MQIKNLGLAWIVVKNLDSAIKFYTQTVGLKVDVFSPEYKWAELVGETGARLGIAEENQTSDVKAGSNAVITLTVEDILSAKNEFLKKDVELVGDLLEVEGHVKMQSFKDLDGNLFQLCQIL